MRFRTPLLAVSLAVALSLLRFPWQTAQAANPPVDAGLLEFLGSVDSDDEAWHQYLANGGNPALRRVHSDPPDPAQNSGAGNPGASGDKPAGSAAPSNSPPVQHAAPGAGSPGGDSSGADGQSSPSGVNHT